MKYFFIIFVLAISGVATVVAGCTIPACHPIHNSALKNSAMQKEIWKDISGYEGLYQVSNLGRVKSLERQVNSKGGSKRTIEESILKIDDSREYLSVTLSIAQVKKHKTVHRLIMDAFVPNPENKPQINHKNGIKTDNRLSNLEWVTRSENMQHAVDYGLVPVTKYWKGKKGYRHTSSKAVIQFRGNAIINDFGSVAEAGRMTGICESCISKICRRGYGLAGGYEWKYKD